MSGGMDIDWNLRDKILTRAEKKFGHLSYQEIINLSDKNAQQQRAIAGQIEGLMNDKRLLLDEEEEIWSILKSRKKL